MARITWLPPTCDSVGTGLMLQPRRLPVEASWMSLPQLPPLTFPSNKAPAPMTTVRLPPVDAQPLWAAPM